MIRLVHRTCNDRIIAAATEALESGWFAMGPVTKGLEDRAQSLLGLKYGIATSSATSALYVAFSTLLNRGDRVIVSPLTFASVASAIILSGGVPVFADVEKWSGGLDVQSVRDHFRDGAKAVVLSNYAGIPSNSGIAKVARDFGVFVVDDSAHALGSIRADGVPIQCSADVAVLSFNSTKICSCGEGGMLATNNPDLAEQFRLRRNYGMTKTSFEKMVEGPSFDVQVAGLNAKFTDISAAILLPQLDVENLARIRTVRAEHTRRYDDLFGNTSVIPLRPGDGDRPMWIWRPVILPEGAAGRRGRIIGELRSRGVEVGIHYPLMTELSFLCQMGCTWNATPTAAFICRRVLTLPCHEGMDLKEVEFIARTLLSLVEL